MLSISAMSGGQGAYYTTLAREDYYLSGGEPPGLWTGSGAEKLKLDGQIDKDVLSRLFAGFDPKSDKPLVQNAGADSHRPGWDLTFSAPKSVSVLWSQSYKDVANEIRAAQQDSVEKAIQYLEDHAAFTRRGKAGCSQEKTKLVVATFEHGTSRAQDPQLHTHALVLNIAMRSDGTTGSIESKHLYRHKMAAGAIYRAELSYQLQQRLGIETERSGTCFEVKGVPSALIKEFSKRRGEIEEVLEERGFTSSKAAEMAAVSSREVKEHKPREGLIEAWKEVGKTFGFSMHEAQNLVGKIAPPTDIGLSQFRQADAVNKAVTHITAQHAHFPERDLVRFAAQEAQGRGISSACVLEAVRMKMNTKDLIPLNNYGEERFSTPEMLRLEKHLITKAKEHSEFPFHKITDSRAIYSVFEKMPMLSDEQKNAVVHLTAKTGGVAVVTGMAGTGKTTMLKACADIWKGHGFQVLGTCLSGKAADGLAVGAEIEGFTIAKLLMELDKPSDKAKVSLGSKTILVLDEAGMVGTRQMDELLNRVEKASAKIVMVGDAKQLQPIEAGGPFAALSKELGEASLTEIRRQNEPWMRDVVRDMAGGNSVDALRAMTEAGNVQVCKDRSHAITELLNAWELKGVEHPESNLIIASTNEDARIMNREAQDKRQAAGLLGDKRPLKIGGENIFIGDRVMFTKNSYTIGVKNGNLGNVTKISGKNMTVEVDGKFRTFSTDDYEDLALGYAVTTHRAQGVTTENAYLLTNDMMQDRELSYVQVSRARDRTLIFTTVAEAGEDLAKLSETMHRSHQKNLASDFLPPDYQPPSKLSSVLTSFQEMMR